VRLRNPVEGERDSGMIPNGVPCEPEQDSGMIVNADRFPFGISVRLRRNPREAADSRKPAAECVRRYDIHDERARFQKSK
jgi:hypothetical protein